MNQSILAILLAKEIKKYIRQTQTFDWFPSLLHKRTGFTGRLYGRVNLPVRNTFGRIQGQIICLGALFNTYIIW